MRYLLFNLCGMMVSHGEVAEFDFRGSDERPTKSALVGLVSNCLGMVREQRAEMSAMAEGIGTAVATYDGGSSVLDFHTVQSVRPNRRQIPYGTRRNALATGILDTTVTTREWRMDTFHVVALWSYGVVDLDAIAEALRRPLRTPYIGRKAGSFSLPMDPRFVEAASLPEAFKQDPRYSKAREIFRTLPVTPKGTVASDLSGEGIPADALVNVRNDLTSHQSTRAFHPRDELLFNLS
jgi:CRISPR system Cascade subunit CasD